jgi:hypothetical protein
MRPPRPNDRLSVGFGNLFHQQLPDGSHKMTIALNVVAGSALVLMLSLFIGTIVSLMGDR